MDARPTTADSKHSYPPPQLQFLRSISTSAVPRLDSGPNPSSVTVSISSVAATPTRFDQRPQHHYSVQPQSPFPAHVGWLPVLYSQQSSLYHHAALLQYNKLIAPGRGRGGGLQSPALPPLLSTPNVHAGLRSRSSSKVSNKDSTHAKPGTQTCHGNKSVSANNSKSDRAVITGKDKMAQSRKPHADLTNPLPTRPTPPSTSPTNLTATQPTHSNSVPSTPHQHARKFSFESRDPSPNAAQGHSPRSAYSETNGNVPSLRPLPPRSGGCRYETALERTRRRMPYSLGGDRLDTIDSSKIKSKLSEDDERKLTTDMRELYDRLKPTRLVEEKRQKLVQKLENLLNDTWPGNNIRVHLFGSSGNLLCSDGSDVDICITTPMKELEGVCMLADLLAKHGMQKVVCVSSAKVPIVKIWDPELELACDMNVNNTLALENTRMIRTYVEIDERVRPLAMIIKYWTRRRIINDAAFGGTLSSYTWICMIIAFLQVRQPPILPALHQLAQQKSGKTEGEIAPFADDLDQLKGFGSKNKSSLGELLFQFFRFYAHEFDYSERALSVRLGRLMPKTEKKHWILATNNQLCVEEPFNTIRNLGNTVDDISFRGIHLELRRAFDLLVEGKFTQCCEQFVFPKEEERIWQKPASAPRPVLLRSASQQNNHRGGRSGNRGGNRQSGQHRNSNNTSGSHGNNRRASSSTAYENAPHAVFFTGYPYIGSEGMYMQPPPPEVLAHTLSALQLQENNLRFLQYTQNQALAQQQALAHAQRMQGNVSQTQSSSERSRTNSFDTPPLTAPIRPDMWYWQFQGQPYITPQSFTSYPSSPSHNQSAEQRRGAHRTVAASEVGSTAGSSLRSQSQPASRTLPTAQPVPAFPSLVTATNRVASSAARQMNGASIPSFIPDESNDADQEGSSSNTPPGEEKPHSYHLDPSSSPTRGASGNVANGLPAFGDFGPQNLSRNTQGRRRQSSEQFPQSIFDRIKGPSRSPSPLGHSRAYSIGTSSAPLPPGPFVAQGDRIASDSGPLIVNGSNFIPSSTVSSRHPSVGEASSSSELFDNPLHISMRPSESSVRADTTVLEPASRQKHSVNSEIPVQDRPLVVNGSSSPAQPSQPVNRFGNGVKTTLPNGVPNMTNLSPISPSLATTASPAGFQRFMPRQPQSPLIAQLDLATTDAAAAGEAQHLSPVYENGTPSPTTGRRFDLPINVPRIRPNVSGSVRDTKSDVRSKQKSSIDSPPSRTDAAQGTNPRVNGLSRENGHVRGAKSESDNGAPAGAWQKISKGKKKGADTKVKSEVYPQSEQLPKNDSERKGG